MSGRNELMLKARVEAVNAAHAYANELHARLVETFAPFVGTKIERAQGGLMQKVQAQVDALALPCVPALHVYRYGSAYSLTYIVNVSRMYSETTCLYYEVSVFVGSLSNGVLADAPTERAPLRDNYTETEVAKKRKAVEEAKARLSEAQGGLWPFEEYER